MPAKNNRIEIIMNATIILFRTHKLLPVITEIQSSGLFVSYFLLTALLSQR